MARYGTANPGPTPAIYAPANDVTLTAGSEVLAITTTSALVGIPGLSYIPVILGLACITMGGTASSALTLAARYSGGSDFATQVIPAGVLVNSAVLTLAVCLVGASVDAAADGTIGGAAIEITGHTVTQAATWTKIGTQLTILLLPGGQA